MNTAAGSGSGEINDVDSPPPLRSVVDSLREFIVELRTNPPSQMNLQKYMASMIALERGMSLLEDALENDNDFSFDELFNLRDVKLRRRNHAYPG